jgi:hypothetical protein
MTGVKWRRRTLESIAGLLQQHGIHVSPSTVARLLREMDYSLRVNRKMIATSHSPDRSAQFDYLATVRARFERRGLPIISVDTKKRELVGNFKNPGRTWRRTPRAVNDHDFRTDALGIAIPYGIYDVAANHGAVVIGISHNTPCFAVRSIRQWWHRHGRRRYDDAREILILADTGGSNGARCWAWKTETPPPACRTVQPARDRGPLSDGRLQVESHRASTLLGDLETVGRRAPRQLRHDSLAYPLDTHQNGTHGRRVARSAALPNGVHAEHGRDQNAPALTP